MAASGGAADAGETVALEPPAELGSTLTMPIMEGWIMQWYVNVPGVVKVNE